MTICQWYALCDHPAVGTVRHPVLGDVPICQRCADKHDLTIQRFTAERSHNMNNLATSARPQPYLEGKPLDPRTAVCDQHRVGSPMTDTGVGYVTEFPNKDKWPCVICPLPEADLIGTLVMVTNGVSDACLYGGEDSDRPGFISTRIELFSGKHAVVTCSVDSVAPADTPLNEKDPRITIEKMPKKRSYNDSGVWLPHVDHPALASLNPRGMKTKREALQYAARRLAIAEYHATRAAVTA